VKCERGSGHSVCSVEGEWLLSVECERGSGHSVWSVKGGIQCEVWEGEWPLSV